MSSSNEEKEKVDIPKNIACSKKEETNKIEIIEISNIRPNKIPNHLKDNNPNENWVNKLNLPYERNIMRIAQIKEETLKFYINLCDFIDLELRKNKSSLIKEHRKIGTEYYNNLLYTIYCISQEHVVSVYGYKDHYDEYSYKILENHLGSNLREKVFNKAHEQEKQLSPPKAEVREYFNLTSNGLKKKWWDMDGKFRGSHEFSKKELDILEVTPYRNSKVWEIPMVRNHIINLYLEIWKVISDGLEMDIKWRKKIKRNLSKIINDQYKYYYEYENGHILASLIKISENNIREILPNTQILNIEKDKNNVIKYFPKEVVETISERLSEYKNNISDTEMTGLLRAMLKNNPNDWKLRVKRILMYENKRSKQILIKYKNDYNFIKIAKEIIKETEDEDLSLLCLYAINLSEKLSIKNSKLLGKIIHQSNLPIYEKMIKSNEEVSLELLNKLVGLKEPIRKKIELDMDKVILSKKELNKTVEIVKEYIGEEEIHEVLEDNNSPEEIIESEADDSLEVEYKKFISLMLDKGSINIEEGSKIALSNGKLLNAFLSDMNQKFYKYIQDQAIVIEDDHIKIDDFYIDMIRELVFID